MRRLRDALAAQSAYKSYECEDALDAYFYRPAGSLIAQLSRPLNLSANHLTLAGLLLGILGAVFLCRKKGPWPGLALLVVSGAFDAADGQLARLTGTASLAGRILDGVADHLVYIAIYLALCLKCIQHNPVSHAPAACTLVLLAALSHSAQSSLFDLYRTHYMDYVEKRRIPDDWTEPAALDMAQGTAYGGGNWFQQFLRWSYRGYTLRQKRLAKPRTTLERSLLARRPDRRLTQEEADDYRRLNRPMIRFWNILGINSRLVFMVGTLAWGRPELYLWAEVTLFNAWMGLAWCLQAAADRQMAAA